MKTPFTLLLKPEYDTHNSYPHEMKIVIGDEVIEIEIEDNDSRRIAFDKETIRKLLEL